MSNHFAMDVIFKDQRVLEYNDIYFSCIHKENITKVITPKDHALFYLDSGIMDISYDGMKTRINPGECFFIRKDCSVSITETLESSEKPFKAIALVFRRNFLLSYYRKMKDNAPAMSAKRSKEPILKIPARPDVGSLFQSLLPYFWSKEKPSDEWLLMKRTEGLNCILNTDVNVYASLFDFTSKWKIDLKQFMEENYMHDLSLQEFANYSGRSLSTFNRDFRKTFGEMPQKWLIERRLEEAKEMLGNSSSKVQDVMADVGFSNLSHFSRIFKDRYGYPPREEYRRASQEKADEKKRLRKEIRDMVKGLSPETRKDFSQRTCDLIAESDVWKKADSILLFLSMKDEIDTSSLLSQPKKLYVPKVVGEELEIYEYSPNKVSSGAFGILEPTEDATMLKDLETLDLVIVPGVAFTEEGLRMGRGKGFYDRFLPRTSCPTWGIAFPQQIVERLPVEPWDRPLDGVFHL